ncbi:MAG: FtsW/RodA/SpoVE family cell cycle protein [Candidatus Paceibacterota bacterium]
MISKSLSAHVRQWDWPLALSALLLCCFGLTAIYSVGMAKDNMSLFYKQAIFVAVGFVMMFLLSYFDWRVLKNRSYIAVILYFICLGLLGGLFLVKGHRGIQGWYDLGFFYFNPIELLKVVLIVILAKYFSSRHAEMYNFAHVVVSGLYTAVPCVLIFMQPDIGSILVIVSLWVGILLVSGIRMRHLFLLFLIGLVIAFGSWQFLLKDYQRQRIVSFSDAQTDYLGSGWNQQQMLIAIGSGGLWGKGIAKGSQVQLGFLPEPHTDFVFCVIAEEMGLVGVLALFATLMFFLWRVIRLAFYAPDNFSRFFAAGLGISFFAQAVINLAMNLRLFPIVGIPLPLVSYGGGNLIFMFLALGILQSMKVSSIVH